MLWVLTQKQIGEPCDDREFSHISAMTTHNTSGIIRKTYLTPTRYNVFYTI